MLAAVRAILAALVLAGLAARASAGTLVESATLVHDGLVRYFDYYVPSPLPGGRLPLLLLLHGGTQSNDAFATGAPSVFRELADAYGFLLVMPNGTSSTTGTTGPSGQFNWNDCRADAGAAATTADDVGFLSALIDWAAASFAIDSARVYAAGASNGGMMSYRLAFERSDRIAAVAAIIANLPANSECPAEPAGPVSVLVMNGSADLTYMPFGGGQVAGNRGLVLSAHATRDFFRDFLATGPMPSHHTFADLDPQDGGVVDLDLYTGGAAGTEVAFYTLNGAGHNYPSIDHPIAPALVALFGLQNHDIEAAVETWAFLSRHARPAPVPALSPAGGALLAASLLLVAVRGLRAGARRAVPHGPLPCVPAKDFPTPACTLMYLPSRPPHSNPGSAGE